MLRRTLVLWLLLAALGAGFAVRLGAVDLVTWTAQPDLTGDNSWHQAMKYPYGPQLSKMWFWSLDTGNLAMSLTWATMSTYNVVVPPQPTDYTTIVPWQALTTNTAGCPDCADVAYDEFILGAAVAQFDNSHCYYLMRTNYVNWYTHLAVTTPGSTSGNCSDQVYRGQITIDGEYAPGSYSTADNLIVKHGTPNQLISFQNGFCFSTPTTHCPRMARMTSTDPNALVWAWDRNASGYVIDYYPSSLPSTDTAEFMSAAYTSETWTGGKIHLMAADGYPAAAHRHLYSCDWGYNWTVLETAADTYVTDYQPYAKGTVLWYYNNRLEALTNKQRFNYIGPNSHTCP